MAAHETTSAAPITNAAAGMERFFDLTVDLLCIAGLDGVFRRVSPAWTTTLGWSTEELCSQPFLAFVHPDDVESTLAEVASLAEGAVTIEFENRYRCKDGSYRILSWNTAPDPATQTLYASAHDITARRQAEAALAAEQRRTELILDVAGEGIAGFDQAGRLTYANPAAGRIWGAPVPELIGRLGSEIAREIGADDRPVDGESPLAGVLRSRRAIELGTVIELVDGRRLPVDATVTPVRGADGEPAGVVVVVRDATERVRANLELERQAVALERSNQELQQFAYVASHDLQEPLRKIASYVQILEADYGDRLDDDGRQCIQFAVDGAHRMRTLIEDLLELCRAGADTMRPADCDTGAVVRAVIDDLAVSIAETDAVIEVGELPVVRGDDVQLRQVFSNLISNAIKYRSGHAPTIRLAATATREGWLFTVRDDGTGFKQEYGEQVFGMFQRLVSRRQAAGTGIGLAIVRKVVENHGGRIWVESSPGHGATFSFTLPPAAEQAPSRARRAA
jgi:PAS domain S-box-containing protein